MKHQPPTSVRLEPAMKKRLDKISEAEGKRSVGSIIKQAVQEFIERWEANRKK
jgi:predicted transcriptional regulator